METKYKLAKLGNTGPRLWQNRLNAARSVEKRSRANIPITPQASWISKHCLFWHISFEFVGYQKLPVRYCKILTLKEPIRMLGYTGRLPCHTIKLLFAVMIHNRL